MVRRVTYQREQASKIISAAIDKIKETETLSQAPVIDDLNSLKNILDQLRLELNAMRPADIRHKYIPSATDELDAVVSATEEATGNIMDACEAIQNNLGKTDKTAQNSIKNEVVKIFEACTFQDITGQRIAKTAKNLKSIDKKVGQLLDILGNRISIIEDMPEKGEEASIQSSLLNGPQRPENAITQDDIDALLAEFD